MWGLEYRYESMEPAKAGAKLFECMSDNDLFDTPMPSSNVPLLGVHWGDELFGDAAIWVIVEDMKMAI